MCPFQDELKETRPLNSPIAISVANGSKIMAAGIETIRVTLKNKAPIRIEIVLYVPDVDRRLLSISALSAKGLKVTFGNKSFTIKTGQDIVTKVSQTGKLFVLDCILTETANMSEEAGEYTNQLMQASGMPDWDTYRQRR
ncbi:polyprotein [Plasmopara halstedii]|uniref:Polyprotein n=1 Tax=Plasmopara halstedii TaxID=4781 RepID=A0A0P1B0D6_PLAHL|nr:polyprotein [Plasmopara halstedii]CEG46708.1 polyprotein [Plasmopara halstedii]|eukprot:XP_024583077.1 polyprotein [Plasmopara halstedii]